MRDDEWASPSGFDTPEYWAAVAEWKEQFGDGWWYVISQPFAEPGTLVIKLGPKSDPGTVISASLPAPVTYAEMLRAGMAEAKRR